MPIKNEDLHGNAPDKSDVALLLIDVINDLEFPDGEQLFAPCASDGVANRRAESAGESKRNPRRLRQRQFRTLAIGF